MHKLSNLLAIVSVGMLSALSCGDGDGEGGDGKGDGDGTGNASGVSGTSGASSGGSANRGGTSGTDSGGDDSGGTGTGGTRGGTGGTPGGTAGEGGENVGGAGGGSDCELTLCGSECINTASDLANCGECARACATLNASSTACQSGECAPTCSAGFGDCNVDDGNGADDGCETNLNSVATCGTTCANRVACQNGQFCQAGVCVTSCSLSVCGAECVDLDITTAHCGVCSRACSNAGASTTSCGGGECDPTCSAGFDDCNVDDGMGADDGCETNLGTTAASCGSCGRACSSSGASATSCSGGECDPTCNSGFGDCNVDDGVGPDDGCETNVTTGVANCGACGRTCNNTGAAVVVCSGGACDPTCNSGFADCNVDDGIGADDGCETNLGTTAASCGTCGRSCSTAGASATSCSGGECDPTCNTGFGDCVTDDGNGPDDGCETNLATGAGNCGACGRTCSSAGASATACSGGECDPTCSSGFGDCVADDGSGADDGCETNLGTTAASCGTCGRSCSTAGTSATSCSGGACAPTCSAGRGDCNVDSGVGPDDGCETDLTDEATCGTACNDLDVCAANEFCVNGACALDCGALMICGTECANLATDEDHCGACGDACSSANASARACAGSLCAPTCSTGFADCDVDDGMGPDDGCETNLGTTAASCGTCGRTCSSAGTTATSCSGGACAPTCSAGRGDCSVDDGIGADDGCETDLTAAATCGTTCANLDACTGSEFCFSGACVLATGVARTSTPIDQANEGVRYHVLHQGNPPPVNLSGATVTVRAYAPGALNGRLNIYFRSTTNGTTTNPYLNSVFVQLSTLTAGFVDIVVPVPPHNGGTGVNLFDPTTVTVIGTDVESAVGDTGPWQSPATVVYFDSITSSNGAVNDTFNTNFNPMQQSSGRTPVPTGWTLTWQASVAAP